MRRRWLRPLGRCCGRDWMTWVGYARHRASHATHQNAEKPARTTRPTVEAGGVTYTSAGMSPLVVDAANLRPKKAEEMSTTSPTSRSLTPPEYAEVRCACGSVFNMGRCIRCGARQNADQADADTITAALAGVDAATARSLGWTAARDPETGESCGCLVVGSLRTAHPLCTYHGNRAPEKADPGATS